MRLIDAHCHLDLYPDPAAVLATIEQRGIYTIAVTNAPVVFPACQALVSTSRFVRPALGLHPELAHEREQELPRLLALLSQTRYVGEVGLDYVTTEGADRAAQRRVFAAIVQGCALAGGKILTVHSRRAVPDVLAALGDRFPGQVILHWFTGSARQAERAAAQGCYFSVNPAMVTSPNWDRLIATVSRERILTETDGPFVHTHGHPAQPADVVSVTVALAKQWGCSEAEASEQVFISFRRLLGAP